MVFPWVSESETPPSPVSKPSMASTFSAKSQPLHNFSLKDLKWSMNQSSTHRLRRVPDANGTHSSSSPSNHSQRRPVSPLNNDNLHHHRSSCKNSDLGRSTELLRPGSNSEVKNEHRFIKLSYPTANSSGSVKPGRDDLVSDGAKSGSSVSSVEHLIEKEEKSGLLTSNQSSEKKHEKKEKKSKGSEGKSKIFIRIPARNKVAAVDATDAVNEPQCAVEAEETVAKTWNLRPRRTVTKPVNVNGGAPKTAKSGGVLVQEIKPETAQVALEEKVSQKRKEFSVSLSKEEIEEDFLFMTASKPPRRPKKRARVVQKQMDEIFPGLWLTSVTPDMYHVPDGPLKG